MRANKLTDDKPVQDTLPAAGLTSGPEAVEQDLLRLSKQAEIRGFRGKLHWQGDLNAMRTDQ